MVLDRAGRDATQRAIDYIVAHLHAAGEYHGIHVVPVGAARKGGPQRSMVLFRSTRDDPDDEEAPFRITVGTEVADDACRCRMADLEAVEHHYPPDGTNVHADDEFPISMAPDGRPQITELGGYQGPPREPYVREAEKVGRNEPCPCGSGRKYKRCCLRK